MKITKNYLKPLLSLPTNTHQLFHEKTKIKKVIKEIDHHKWPEEWKTIYFKTYPRFDQIILPSPQDLNNISFSEVLYNRKSEREFDKVGLTLEQISTFLYYTVGLRQKNVIYQARNRFYPSAGGRYPMETYLLSLNSDLPKGIYHYNLQEHTLEQLLEISTFDKTMFLGTWEKTSCLLLLTAVFDRTTMKYGTRGYRHVLIEAGHIGQNISLTAAALKLACCSMGGYRDDKVNQLLGVDGLVESIINVTAIGNKKK